MEQEVRLTAGDGVTDWEAGLPSTADLPPLSQSLVPPELASAFIITPEPHRSMIDVDRASRDTVSSLRGQSQHLIDKLKDFRSVSDDIEEENQEIVVEGEETVDLTPDGSPEKKLVKLRRIDGEEADDSSARASKRNRLVWTPQLHKRFVEVVAHLGVKNAVPKTIMQLMNVEGLTRENVASHLQKYRLFLKRKQGLITEPSDHLFDSTPDSGGRSGNENAHAPARAPVPIPIPVPYRPHMVPMPYPPPQIVPNSGGGGGGYPQGFEYHSHQYNMMMQPKDWSGSNFGSGLPYHHRMTPDQN